MANTVTRFGWKTAEEISHHIGLYEDRVPKCCKHLIDSLMITLAGTLKTFVARESI